MTGGSTPKASELEKQLAQQARNMYDTANSLNGGKDYLTNESTKVDRTERYQEANNASVAAALSKMVTNPLSDSSVDNRGLAGGAVAAESDANTQQQTAAFSLANSGLGTQALADQATARQEHADYQTQFMNDQAKEIKSSILPSALGAAVGGIAATKEGRDWAKATAGEGWDNMKGFFSTAPDASTVKSPLTGSFGGMIR